MTGAFDMGPHAAFVWASFALGMAVFAWNAFSPLLQRRSLVDRLAALDEERA